MGWRNANSLDHRQRVTGRCGRSAGGQWAPRIFDANSGQVSNGVSHTLQIRYETSASQLPGSPAMLTCGGSAGADYTGWVENLSCSAISGWAVAKNSLNTSINIGVYDGVTLLSTAAASQLRADVGTFLGDYGLHGFGLTSPAALKDGKVHAVTVRQVGSSVALPGPQSMICP